MRILQKLLIAAAICSVLICSCYADAELIKTYSEKSLVIHEEYRDGDRLTTGTEGFSTHDITYDENNRRVSERYYGVNGEPALYWRNYTGIDREFDENGNSIRETYYDLSGKVGPHRRGYVILEKEYNDKKQVILERYYDADSRPMEISGMFQKQMAYDEQGNVSVEIALDENGERILVPDGWNEHRMQYDADQQVVSEQYFGLEGEPVLFREQYSRQDQDYDGNGKVIRQSYFDTDGEPVINGWHQTLIRQYDEDGRVIRESYYGPDGMAMGNWNGYAAIERRYDESGLVIEETYYDTSGNRFNNKQGYATVLNQYDENGLVISRRYFDKKGQAASVNGTFLVTYAYDENGNVISESYFDENGSRTAGSIGYAAKHTLHDENGNIITESYYDTNGQPVETADGYASIFSVFDENNRCLSREYRDTSGNPAIHQRLKYAKVLYEYDAKGNRISETYLNEYLNPTAPQRWEAEYAAVRWEYDEFDRIISEKYFDINGNLSVVALKGYAGYQNEYSEDGTVVLTTYMDGYWKTRMTSNRMPYSMVRKTYDKTGTLLLREDYLDFNGNPVPVKMGIYGKIYAYDSLGRVIREGTIDAYGNLYNRKEKNMYAVTEYTYDAYGKRTSETFTAAEYDWNSGYAEGKMVG